MAPRIAVVRALLCTLAICAVHATAASAARLACTGNPSTVHVLHITVDGVRTYGYYVLPRAHRPRGLVVVAHGYQRAADSEIGHLLRLAVPVGG